MFLVVVAVVVVLRVVLLLILKKMINVFAELFIVWLLPLFHFFLFSLSLIFHCFGDNLTYMCRGPRGQCVSVFYGWNEKKHIRS